MNDIKSTEFSVLAFEQKYGSTEETRKMHQYLLDVLVIQDEKVVADILQAINIRVQELTEEFGKRDTDPAPRDD